jgi:5-hydroxyisourate hydrolase-like protein (transthyretin family)
LATITFTVKYPDGTPAPGATVKVMDMWETTTYASATTDFSGKCSITLTQGDYMVHAEKAGYNPSYSYYYDFSTDMSVELWLREITTPPPSQNVLTVKVYNQKTGSPIQGLKVYLFAGSGGIEPPENASYTGVTGSNGNAVFTIPSGFYRVLVSSDGGRYAAADPNMTVPDQWKNTYAAYSAVGVPPETTLDIPITETGYPPTPKPSIVSYIISLASIILGAFSAYIMRR